MKVMKKLLTSKQVQLELEIRRETISIITTVKWKKKKLAIEKMKIL